jgi:hypothetical protein
VLLRRTTLRRPEKRRKRLIRIAAPPHMAAGRSMNMYSPSLSPISEYLGVPNHEVEIELVLDTFCVKPKYDSVGG